MEWGFADSDQGRRWFDSLRLASGQLDALSQQCVTVEDLRIHLAGIQDRILELLRINGEILRFLGSRLQKAMSEMSTEVETAEGAKRSDSEVDR